MHNQNNKLTSSMDSEIMNKYPNANTSPIHPHHPDSQAFLDIRPNPYNHEISFTKRHSNSFSRSHDINAELGNISGSFRERRSFEMEESEVMKVEAEDVQRKSFKKLEPIEYIPINQEPRAEARTYMNYECKFYSEQFYNFLYETVGLLSLAYRKHIKLGFMSIKGIAKKNKAAEQLTYLLSSKITGIRSVWFSIFKKGISQTNYNNNFEQKLPRFQQKQIPSKLLPLFSNLPSPKKKAEFNNSSKPQYFFYPSFSRVQEMKQKPLLMRQAQEKIPNNLYHMLPDQMVDAPSDLSLHLCLDIKMDWMSSLDEKQSLKVPKYFGNKQSIQQKSTTDYIQFSSRNLQSQPYFQSNRELKSMYSPKQFDQKSIKRNLEIYQQSEYFTKVGENPVNRIKNSMINKKQILAKKRPKSMTTVTFSYKNASMIGPPKNIIPPHQVKTTTSTNQYQQKRVVSQSYHFSHNASIKQRSPDRNHSPTQQYTPHIKQKIFQNLQSLNPISHSQQKRIVFNSPHKTPKVYHSPLSRHPTIQQNSQYPKRTRVCQEYFTTDRFQ